MTLLRSIWADLREQRLWPLAAILVVALVAAPVAVSKLGGTDPEPAPLPTAPTAKAAAPVATTQLTSVTPSVTAAVPQGRYRDPFAGPSTHAASDDRQARETAPPEPHRSPAAHEAPASSSAPAPAPAAAAPAAAPAHVAAARPASPRFAAGYRSDLTWGQEGDDELEIRDVVRLARLKAGARTAAIYMGVREGGRVAVFLLAPGVTASGEGDCYPTDDVCQLVQLRQGDAEQLAVTQADGRVSHYRLRLGRIVARHAATESAARRMRRRESHSGRSSLYAIVRSGRTYVSEFMYSGARGVLFKHEVGRIPAQ